MVATLLATLFAGITALTLGVMIFSWLKFGYRFRELRCELRAANDPLTVRYTWRNSGMPTSAVIYNLNFKAKAEGLPFHPKVPAKVQGASDLLAAA